MMKRCFTRNICLLFMIVLMSMTSCARVEQRDQLAVELPAGFSDQGQAPYRPDWWLTFNDPGLTDVIETALSGNLSLLVAYDRLQQAQAVARRTGADRYPEVSGSGLARESWTDRDESNNVTTLSIGLAASYEVDLWGRIRAGSEAASLDVEAGRADLQAAAVSVSAQVALTWYQIAEIKQEQELVRRQRELNEQILAIVTAQFKAGKVGVADVMQQRGLIERSNGELITLTARLHNQEQQLALLLGLAPGTGSMPSPEELVDLPPLPVTGIPADLINSRPDIRSAYASLRAADQRVAEAVANQFPRLSLSADASSGGDSGSDLFSDWAAALAGNLVGPIFDGGRRRAEVDRTQAVSSQFFHQYSQTLIDAVAEVEDSLVQEREQEKLLDNLAVRLKLAQTTAQRVGDRYRQGVEDYQRVLTALLSLQGLQTDILRAEQNLIEYRISLYRALGGHIDLPEMGIAGAVVNLRAFDRDE